MFKYLYLIMVLILISTPSANADQIIRNAKILIIGTQDDYDGRVDTFWLKLDKSMGPSACHTASLDRVIFDLSKPVSKAAMSLALTAYTTGKTVDIDTYADCLNGWSVVRNLYFSPGQ